MYPTLPGYPQAHELAPSLLTAHNQPSQDTRREGDADGAGGSWVQPLMSKHLLTCLGYSLFELQDLE